MVGSIARHILSCLRREGEDKKDWTVSVVHTHYRLCSRLRPPIHSSTRRPAANWFPFVVTPLQPFPGLDYDRMLAELTSKDDDESKHIRVRAQSENRIYVDIIIYISDICSPY